jgi:nucleoid-associated protein YgaU
MNRYTNIARRVVEGKEVTSPTVYPESEPSDQDYYVITTSGDRFDILAQQFYNNQSYWWVIASANPTVRRDTMFIDPGIQLRIPPLLPILGEYQQENSNR